MNYTASKTPAPFRLMSSGGFKKAVFLTVVCTTLAWAGPRAYSGSFQAARERLLERQRRIIYNNDGVEVFLFPAGMEITPENVLDRRTTDLVGTQVDSIFYNAANPSFGLVTHYSEVFDIRGYYEDRHRRENRVNASWPLIEQGRDSLQVMVDFARENDIEIFLSKRMNDTHDSGRHRPDSPNPTFAPLKIRNPDFLFGRHDNRPPHGEWSSVDYGHPEVRELAYRYLEEVCRNYDIDGIELDFFRGPRIFKSVAWGGAATREQLDTMTALIRRIREMTEREGRRRGRPILVAMRVPDSVDYSRRVGLDIEGWMSEGLVDILIPAGVFRFNAWEYSVKLGHEHGVKVYPCLVDPNSRTWEGRGSLEAHRARAMNAWAAGVDGVYLFNMFDPRHPMLNEIGAPDTLAGLDKLYFISGRGDAGGSNPERFVDLQGDNLFSYRVVTPQSPVSLRESEPLELTIDVGEDMSAARETGMRPAATLRLLVPGVSDPDEVRVSLNGHELREGRLSNAYLEYAVEPHVRTGKNHLRLTAREADTSGYSMSHAPPASGNGVAITRINVEAPGGRALRIHMQGQARGEAKIGSFSIRTARNAEAVPPGFEQAPNGHYYPAGWTFPGLLPGSPRDENPEDNAVTLTLPMENARPGDYLLELIVQNRPQTGAYYNDIRAIAFSVDSEGGIHPPRPLEDVQIKISYRDDG